MNSVPELTNDELAEARKLIGFANLQRWKYTDHVAGDPSYQDARGCIYLASEVREMLERERPSGAWDDLLKAARKIQQDAEVYGLAGATNLPAVKCEVKGLTLGHWYNLADALKRVTEQNTEVCNRGGEN